MNLCPDKDSFALNLCPIENESLSHQNESLSQVDTLLSMNLCPGKNESLSWQGIKLILNLCPGEGVFGDGHNFGN